MLVSKKIIWAEIIMAVILVILIVAAFVAIPLAGVTAGATLGIIPIVWGIVGILIPVMVITGLAGLITGIVEKETKKKKGSSVMLLSIHEGRNRQIKKMCKAIDHPVLELYRTKIGPITIGSLKPGEYRTLTDAEVKKLKKAVALE